MQSIIEGDGNNDRDSLVLRFERTASHASEGGMGWNPNMNGSVPAGSPDLLSRLPAGLGIDVMLRRGDFTRWWHACEAQCQLGLLRLGKGLEGSFEEAALGLGIVGLSSCGLGLLRQLHLL